MCDFKKKLLDAPPIRSLDQNNNVIALEEQKSASCTGFPFMQWPRPDHVAKIKLFLLSKLVPILLIYKWKQKFAKISAPIGEETNYSERVALPKIELNALDIKQLCKKDRQKRVVKRTSALALAGVKGEQVKPHDVSDCCCFNCFKGIYMIILILLWRFLNWRKKRIYNLIAKIWKCLQTTNKFLHWFFWISKTLLIFYWDFWYRINSSEDL